MALKHDDVGVGYAPSRNANLSLVKIAADRILESHSHRLYPHDLVPLWVLMCSRATTPLVSFATQTGTLWRRLVCIPFLLILDRRNFLGGRAGDVEYRIRFAFRKYRASHVLVSLGPLSGCSSTKAERTVESISLVPKEGKLTT
jgi:hypothetical protein